MKAVASGPSSEKTLLRVNEWLVARKTKLASYTVLVLAALALCAGSARATHTCTTCYSDYENGCDTNDGTTKTQTSGSCPAGGSGPWKHAPGMMGLTPSDTSTGDGCASVCLSQVPAAGDSYVLKGGVIWPYTAMPWWLPTTVHGSGSTSTYGCTGSGCISITVDPTWNKGIVNSVTLTRDLGGCSFTSPPTVTITGGGGSGAAATAYVVNSAWVTSGSLETAGFVYHVAVTNQGSGYTSNPTVTISGGGCIGITAVADIDRAIIDYGALTGTPPVWPVGNGPNYSAGLVGDGIFTNGAFMVIDHQEVRNMLQQSRDGTTAGCDNFPDGNDTGFIHTGANTTVSNSYVHGRFASCTTDGNQEGYDAGILSGLDNEITGNTLENGDDVGSYASCTNTPCEFSESSIHAANDSEVQHNYSYSASWWIRSGGPYTDQPLLIHNNESWLNLYQADSEHENEYYTLMSAGTLYNYDNILHSAVAGSYNGQQMGNGTTQYFFNNVAWGLGTGSSSWSIDSIFGAGAGGGHFYFYQNTIYGDSSGTRNCLDGNSGTYTSDLYVVLQGNHCVTAANPWWNASAMAPANFSNYAGSTVQATINASSTVQSAATAAAQGYTIANLFAPTASTNDTVTFASNANSYNLTASCTSNVYLAALCKDINGKQRPATGGWQAGAYLYALTPPLPAVSSRTLQ